MATNRTRTGSVADVQKRMLTTSTKSQRTACAEHVKAVTICKETFSSLVSLKRSQKWQNQDIGKKALDEFQVVEF